MATNTVSQPAPRQRGRRGNAWWGTVFSLPGLIFLLLFLILPFCFAIYLSFTNARLNSARPIDLVGFRNYIRVFEDADFWRAFSNNLIFAAVVVPVQTALALWMAVLVNKKVRAVKFFRAVFFLPVIVVLTVAAVIWFLLLDPSNGLVNGFLRVISFGAIESSWLQSTAMALPAIMLISIWQGAGFQMIILLAGLQDIPQELYEASAIDGASKRQQFFYVTLPQLRNTLIFVITITMILSFRLFDQVWALTRGGPLNATNTVMVELVDTGFERKAIAQASAIAVVFFIVVLMLTIVQRKFLKEERES